MVTLLTPWKFIFMDHFPCVICSGTSKQRPCQGTSLLARLWPLFLCKFVFLSYIIPLHGYLRFDGECVDERNHTLISAGPCFTSILQNLVTGL